MFFFFASIDVCHAHNIMAVPKKCMDQASLDNVSVKTNVFFFSLSNYVQIELRIIPAMFTA